MEDDERKNNPAVDQQQRPQYPRQQRRITKRKLSKTTAATTGTALTQLEAENKRLQLMLTATQQRLEYVSQRCCGCDAPLVDSERVFADCCHRPVCADCQSLWVHNAIKIEPRHGFVELDSVAVAFGHYTLSSQPKSLCCFTDFSSISDYGDDDDDDDDSVMMVANNSSGSAPRFLKPGNPAHYLFSLPSRRLSPHQVLRQGGGEEEKKTTPRCEQCQRPSVVVGLQHALFACPNSNVIRCPLCHAAGSLTNVNTTMSQPASSIKQGKVDGKWHWQSFDHAVFHHMRQTCSATPMCSRCGVGSDAEHGGAQSRHRLSLHFAEDWAIASLAKALASVSELSQIVALPPPPPSGAAAIGAAAAEEEEEKERARFLAYDVVDAFALVFLNIVGEQLLGAYSYHHVAVHRALYQLAAVLRDVRGMLLDSLHETDTSSSSSSSSSSAATAAAVATTHHDLKQTIAEASKRLCVDFLQPFGRDILGKAAFHEGARLMPVRVEREYASRARSTEFPQAAWSLSSCPAVGWVFSRVVTALAALNRHHPLALATFVAVEPRLATTLPVSLKVLKAACTAFGSSTTTVLRDILVVLVSRGYCTDYAVAAAATNSVPTTTASSSGLLARGLPSAAAVVADSNGSWSSMPLPEDSQMAMVDRALVLLLSEDNDE